MIKRFKSINGKYIEKIYGQERLAYAMSDTQDVYDLIEWSKRGEYQGSVIYFYDFETGDVYQPFEKRKNTVYSRPIFADSCYYFLQGCYDENRIILYRYFPDKVLEAVVELSADEVELYNLQIVGNPLHIVSEGDSLRCYYPEPFEIPLYSNETLCFIEDGRVYIEAWIEEGWDSEADCATAQYDFYNKLIIKDFSGNTISEEKGYMHQAPDGSWWLA